MADPGNAVKNTKKGCRVTNNETTDPKNTTLFSMLTPKTKVQQNIKVIQKLDNQATIMRIYFRPIFILLLAAGIQACDSYSKYKIDSKPLIKIDTGLLGIWKDKEDKGVAESISDEFLDFKANGNHYYYITYMDAHGRNPHYQQWDAFLSDV